jgi:chlorobactene glucosyltransferase
MLILWILTILTALGVAIFAARVAIFLRRCQALLPSGAAPADAPLISVVLPARNEAANIERCVRSLLAQNYPNFEVVVVDDGSTDATPLILAQLAAENTRLRVVRNNRLPRGWTGKNHAAHVGARSAHGDWLLFVDADVTLHPGALSAAYLAAHAHGAAMLSLWAHQELLSFWERVAQPVIVGMGQATDPFQHVNSARHPGAAFANGQFILVERRAYVRIGGHAAVRDEVLEDQELSRRFKCAGEPMLMMDGTHVLSTRMYSSLGGIWEGWSKNNFLTLQRNPLLTLAAMISVYFVAVSPFVMALAIPLAGFKFNYQVFDPLLINLLAIMVVLAIRWRAHDYFGTPARYFIWHALGGLIFMGIMLNSAYRHLGGRGVTWKGRKYGDVDVVS